MLLCEPPIKAGNVTWKSIKQGIHQAHERISDGYGLIPPQGVSHTLSSYDLWNFERHVYRPLDSLINHYFNKQTLSHLHLLDAGCGNGQISSVYAALGIGKITAIDFSLRMLSAFKVRFENAEDSLRYQRIVADVEKLDAIRDTQFDLINFFGVIEHLDHPESAIHQLLRVLKPGGVLLLGVPRLWSLAHATYMIFGIPPSQWGKRLRISSYFSFREKCAYYRYYSPAQIFTFLDSSKIPFSLLNRVPVAFLHMDGIAGRWLNYLGAQGETGYRRLDMINRMLQIVGFVPAGEWWIIRRD